MMRYLILIYWVIFSCVSFAFTTGQYFRRIDERTALFQTAYRSYTKPDPQVPGRVITVQLIGMSHVALPQFYREVENLIKDKVVLYELCGGTIEEQKAVANKFHALPSPHKERYVSYFEEVDTPNCLGEVSQKDLSYKNCKELVHADAKDDPYHPRSQPVTACDWEELREDHWAWICAHGSREDCIKFIDKKILKDMKRHGVACDESTMDKFLPALVRACKEGRPKETCEGLSASLRKSEQEDAKSVDEIRRDKENFGKGMSDPAKEKFILVERNEYIFSALKELWGRHEIPQETVVAYGACHLPLVEDFLIAQGFTPLAGSEGWLTVAELVRLPEKKMVATSNNKELLNAPATSLSEQEFVNRFFHTYVKRTFTSLDGLTKVHLIGPTLASFNYNNDFCISDNEFLHNVVSQNYRAVIDSELAKKYVSWVKDCVLYQKNQLQMHMNHLTQKICFNPSKKSSTIEIVFTPQDLIKLQGDLLKHGFALTQSAIAPQPMIELVAKHPLFILAQKIAW